MKGSTKFWLILLFTAIAALVKFVIVPYWWSEITKTITYLLIFSYLWINGVFYDEKWSIIYYAVSALKKFNNFLDKNIK